MAASNTDIITVSENTIPLFEIWVGQNGRIWFWKKNIQNFTSLGKITTIIPGSPEYEPWLVDACIVFAPKYFESCSSLEKIKLEFKDKTFLDFDLDKNIPESWSQLRREALPIYKKLVISFESIPPSDPRSDTNQYHW